MEPNRILWVHNWLFALTEDTAALQPAYDDSSWQPVTLPHDWQIDQPRTKDAPGGGCQGYYPREQVGVYRLHFRAEEEWRGKQVRLLFDGVQRFSEVWLNGVQVGGHAYGYVPFLADLSDALDVEGENVLAVRVDNRAVGQEYAASGDRWYSGAGIIRDVWLLVDEAVHLTHDGLRITATPIHNGPSGDVPDVAGIRCDKARCAVTCEVSGDSRGRTVTLTVTTPDGSTVFTGERPAQALVRWAFDIPKPRLWSPDTPVLYHARVEMDGDALISAFGVRSAVFDTEDGFLLNGQKTKLWGVNLHHDGGAVGAAVPPEIWVRRLKALKQMGVNTIRCAHHPMPEFFYALLDEMGFLCMDELVDKWEGCGMYFDRTWHARHEDLAAMIRRDANHPSIILWSVGNEIGHQFSEKFYTYLKELVDATRALDATRAVTCVLISCVLRDYNDITPMGVKLAALQRYAELVDVVCGNYMEHYYEKMREYGIRKPVLGSEVAMYYRKDEHALNNAQFSRENPYTIVKKYDWVCGSILWAGVDYLGEAMLWPQRGWTGNPLDATADWKLRAWYVASHFKQEPVLKICVYDESEPWDGARGMWGFPQMRSHWKLPHFEKVYHVAVMTNCDKVLLYQNSQTVRYGFRRDDDDGMVHFYLPYIPGILRAEGYMGAMKVAEDVLYSDHEADHLTVTLDRNELPADGRSVAMIDLTVNDRHGRRFMLEDRLVTVKAEGAPVEIRMDNGNAWDTTPFLRTACPTHNGHLLVLLKTGTAPGEVRLMLNVEGFGQRALALQLR
ncbi:MAG: glycoside hydrolase family 2 protein [Aristaeellaceae bacterium]